MIAKLESGEVKESLALLSYERGPAFRGLNSMTSAQVQQETAARTESGSRHIVVRYDIDVPDDFAGSSVDSQETHLQRKGSIAIPVESDGQLPDALESARKQMNAILSQWKDAIGELEKKKEVEVVKAAEERKKAERMMAKSRASAGDENDEDEGSSDEEGDGDEEN